MPRSVTNNRVAVESTSHPVREPTVDASMVGVGTISDRRFVLSTCNFKSSCDWLATVLVRIDGS